MPNLTTFRISGCYIESYLPSFLHALPSLKYLDISDIYIQRTEVTLEHSQIEKVVISFSKLEKVILVMPSLVRVCVIASKVRMLQVIASDTVTLCSFRSIETKIEVTREEMVNFYTFENWGALEECEEGW